MAKEGDTSILLKKTHRGNDVNNFDVSSARIYEIAGSS